MPRFIIKVVPDVDFYVEWSTVVDNWTKAGTREEFISQWGEDPARLDRADETGSSAIPPFFKWDETEFIIDGRYTIQRVFLPAYIYMTMDGVERDEEAIKSLIKEIEWED